MNPPSTHLGHGVWQKGKGLCFEEICTRCYSCCYDQILGGKQHEGGEVDCGSGCEQMGTYLCADRKLQPLFARTQVAEQGDRGNPGLFSPFGLSSLSLSSSASFLH